MRRSLLLRALGVAGLLCVAAPAVRAQFALDSDVRRAIQLYQSGRYDAAATELARLVQQGKITNADRAVADLYRGFAFLRLRRDAESNRALERSIATDPALRPDPVSNAPELIEAWRRARMRVPLMQSFEIAPSEFVPGVDSAARVNVTFESTPAERRFSAIVRLLLLRSGTADTVVAWRGEEGQVARWDGNVRGQPISAGLWDIMLEARAPGADVVSALRKRAEVEVVTSTAERRLPMPPAPRLLPETISFNRVDDAAKRARISRGLWIGAAGAALTWYSFSQAQSAIDETPKGSAQRMIVAGTYVGGVGALLVGGYTALTGYLRSYEAPVAFPSTENVRRNRELRRQYADDSTRVEERNRAFAVGKLVRLRFLEEVR